MWTAAELDFQSRLRSLALTAVQTRRSPAASMSKLSSRMLACMLREQNTQDLIAPRSGSRLCGHTAQARALCLAQEVKNSRRGLRFAFGLWRPLQAAASTKQQRALSVLRHGSQTKFDNNFSLKVSDGRSLKGDPPSALFATFNLHLDMRKPFSPKKKAERALGPG